jgi:hypothetical protein
VFAPRGKGGREAQGDAQCDEKRSESVQDGTTRERDVCGMHSKGRKERRTEERTAEYPRGRGANIIITS